MARRVDLIYAPSGAGKTTFCLDVARYLFATTGKKTIWYLGDGGGETIYNTGWAGPDGFIRVVPFATRPHPLETCQLICEGFLPSKLEDPLSPLVKTSVDELKDIGLWVFEGLTFMSDYMMGDKEGGMAWRASKGQSIQPKDAPFQVKDGTLAFGGNGRSDYGFVQRRIMDLVQRTYALPGMVLFTAHERRIDDEDTRETLFGPDVCGKALTAKIGGAFGNTLHLQRVHVTKKVTDPTTKKQIDQIVMERRLYTREHVDPEAKTFIKYIANTRLPRLVQEAQPDFMPEYLTPPDAMQFYRILQEAEALNKTLEATRAQQDNSTTLVSLL